MKMKLYIFLAFLSVGIVSCDLGDDPAIGGTATEKVAGEWFVYYSVDGEDVSGYTLVTTSNTAANVANEMLITDDANFWDYKVKSPLNLDAKTFGGPALANLVPGYDITVNLLNGKILSDAATSTGGNTTDSIYFEMEFSDDPGTIYTGSGYRRTGFLEDEH